MPLSSVITGPPERITSQGSAANPQSDGATSEASENALTAKQRQLEATLELVKDAQQRAELTLRALTAQNDLAIINDAIQRTEAQPDLARLRARRAWELRTQYGYTLERIRAQMVEEGHDRVEREELRLLIAAEADRRADSVREEMLRLKLVQSAQLENIFSDALAAWRRSLEDTQEVVVETGRAVPIRRVAPDGTEFLDFQIAPPRTTTKTTRGRGDPAHLRAAMEAQRALRELWGLEAPRKLDLTSGGAPLIQFNITPPDESASERARQAANDLAMDAEFVVNPHPAAVVNGRDLHETNASQFALPLGHPDRQPDR